MPPPFPGVVLSVTLELLSVMPPPSPAEMPPYVLPVTVELLSVTEPSPVLIPVPPPVIVRPVIVTLGPPGCPKTLSTVPSLLSPSRVAWRPRPGVRQRGGGGSARQSAGSPPRKRRRCRYRRGRSRSRLAWLCRI